MTSLGHDQYTVILLIQALEHPICGTRFGENCKTTMSSSSWCVLLFEGPHAMDVLQTIPHVLWVNGQGMNDKPGAQLM